MSASRGRGWFTRGKHENADGPTPVADEKTLPIRERADFAVDIWKSDPRDESDGDTVTSWPLDDHGAESSVPASSNPPGTEAAVGQMSMLNQVTRELPAPSLTAPPTVNPPVAEVIGDIHVPQIVIGSPSPEVEPKYTGDQFRSFPFRPDTVVDGWSLDWVTVRGASLRGHFHRYNSAPRQDDFAVHQLADGRIVALVADGVSQSHQSHLGATAAVRAASRWLETNASPVTENTDWLAMMKDAAWALAEQARVTFKLDNPDPEMAFKHMSTTLLCAVIEVGQDGNLTAFIVCVGDSGAWILRNGEFASVLGGKSVGEGGISSSAVVGLPQVPTSLDVTAVDVGPGDVLLLGTDGFGDPLGNGSGGVGNLFRELLGGPRPPSLIEFAHGLDFSRETFDDDRTLIAVTPRLAAERAL